MFYLLCLFVPIPTVFTYLPRTKYFDAKRLNVTELSGNLAIVFNMLNVRLYGASTHHLKNTTKEIHGRVYLLNSQKISCYTTAASTYEMFRCKAHRPFPSRHTYRPHEPHESLVTWSSTTSSSLVMRFRRLSDEGWTNLIGPTPAPPRPATGTRTHFISTTFVVNQSLDEHSCSFNSSDNSENRRHSWCGLHSVTANDVDGRYI